MENAWKMPWETWWNHRFFWGCLFVDKPPVETTWNNNIRKACDLNWGCHVGKSIEPKLLKASDKHLERNWDEMGMSCMGLAQNSVSQPLHGRFVKHDRQNHLWAQNSLCICQRINDVWSMLKLVLNIPSKNRRNPWFFNCDTSTKRSYHHQSRWPSTPPPFRPDGSLEVASPSFSSCEGPIWDLPLKMG